MPKASVILPVFNAEPYLAEAVQSIADQTFRDFECLLLNDGSTDSSLEILEKFAAKDARFKIHSWPNCGLVQTLNKGLDLAQGEIIFRMDADDVSRPKRFERQIAYLESHPDCVAAGTKTLLIDPEGLPICEFDILIDHADIDRGHMRGDLCHIAHPSAVFRKSALMQIGGYRQEFRHAEDVDLFLRLAEFGKLANMPEVLFNYRQHFGSIGYQHSAEQHDAARRASIDARARRGLPPPRIETVVVNRVTAGTMHRKLAWWALGARNHDTAHKETWKALKAAPFALENLKLLACIIRGY